MTPEKMTLIYNIQAIATKVDPRTDTTKLFTAYEKLSESELRASQDRWLEKYHEKLETA
jgi:hypothetical protein